MEITKTRIIILIAVGLVLLFGIAVLGPSFVIDQVEKANYCEVKEDCTRAGLGCCGGYVVNKKEAAKIDSLSAFTVFTASDCSLVNCLPQEKTELVCVNKTCNVKYKGQP